MNMMKIEEVVGDVILVILENYDPLKKIGIKSDKIFVRVKGYDEHGMWIHQPQFNIPKINSTKKNDTQKVKASILIPWGFIVSVATETMNPHGINIEAFTFCVSFFFVEFILGMLN